MTTQTVMLVVTTAREVVHKIKDAFFNKSKSERDLMGRKYCLKCIPTSIKAIISIKQYILLFQLSKDLQSFVNISQINK